MQPPVGSFCDCICFTASLLQMKGPVRSTDIMLYQSCNVVSVKGISSCIPALLINTSTLRKLFIVSSINLMQSFSCDTSPLIATESQVVVFFISSTTCSASSNFL